MVVCCGNVSSYKQDSVWSWFICFCTTTCMILTIGFTFALGVLLPVFMDSFDESRERAAWASSIIIGVFCFLGPVMGALLNRFGFRIATILGCLLCSAALSLGSFAPNIIILYIAFSLPFAVGVSFIYVSSPIIVTHYFTKRRSFALGIVTAGQGLGTMILGPTLQALVDVFDWRNTFRVFAGILTLTSLSGCFLHQRTPTSNEHERAPRKKFRLNLSLLKNPIIIVMLIRNGLCTFARMVPYVHLIKHCDDLGIPADKSSTLYLFIGIFASIGRLLVGFLCNTRFIKARHIQQASTFIGGSSTMLLTLAKSYAALVVYAITFSIADGMMVTSLIIECMESVEESKRALAFGFVLTSGGAFGLGSPPLAGFMADTFGNYIAAFLMAGGLGIVGSVIPFVLLCVKHESEQDISHDIERKIQDQGQSEEIDEQELKPMSLSQDSTLIIRKDHQRSSSFTTAMESPLY
ncbi:hypothetical protein ACROYT_G041637 [Oculina patagonica]